MAESALVPGPREMLIWTWLWYGSVVFAGFACCSTVPSGSLAGTKKRLGRIPAFVSSVTAACSVWPLTSGIVAFAGVGAGLGAAALVVVPAVVAVVGAVVVA